MKIVFFGEDNFSLEVIKELAKSEEIELIVCPIYNNKIYKRLELGARILGIEFCRINDINSDFIVEKIQKIQPDLIISCHFSKIIDTRILDLAKIMAINLHPSLLPKYRGMSPQHWALINGDKNTAITIHEMKADVDSGDILKQIIVPIDENENVFELQNKMLPLYKKAFCELMDDFKNNNVKRISQEKNDEIYYGKFYPEYAIINLRQNKKSLKNLVRAVTKPYCGASYNDLIIWSVCDIEKDLEYEIMKKFPRCGIINFKKQKYFRLFDGVLLIKDFSDRGGVARNFASCYALVA